MDCIEFDDVTFSYPQEEETPLPLFEHFSGKIPAGFTSLIGPNGSGKSTFLMLASGRLVPQSGKCLLFGKDIAHLDQEEKNLLASVIYQNMEFESTDTVSHLLHFVYANGALKGKANALYSQKDILLELTDVFELGAVLDHSLVHLSKGEIQRVLLAFSILYGSKSIFMDEPFFAMEARQKETALAYLRDYSQKTETALFVSMHELDLTRRFFPNVLLFYPNRDMDFGTAQEVLTTQALEKAYGVPEAMLKHSEDLSREAIVQTNEAFFEAAKAVNATR